MTTPFTPGPWGWIHNSASDSRTACIEVKPGGPYRGDVASLQSCEHINGISMAETEANARLISSAPDLLLALERITSSYRSLLARHPVRDVAETLAEADAAIRKARGET